MLSAVALSAAAALVVRYDIEICGWSATSIRISRPLQKGNCKNSRLDHSCIDFGGCCAWLQ